MLQKQTLGLLIIFLLLILIQIFAVIEFLKKKKRLIKAADDIRKSDNIFVDEYYDSFVSDSDFIKKMRKNRLILALGKGPKENEEKWNTLFNNAKNPWGITPTIFRAIRIGVFLTGLFLALMLYLMMDKNYYALFGLFISFLGWWYPMYYYKAIAEERETEWDKMYEFMWVVKHSAQLYDAKKVCLETMRYIQDHYPKYKELITGFKDFYNNWEEDAKELPEFILKYYNFPIPKEIYTILFEMQASGISPDQSLDNLRVFALNKHNGKIQKFLSTVPSKATIFSLPFLMISVIIALLVPMIMSLIKIM